MLTISLSFPGGRYHATPWGRHVNEAVPEWPPSPYRLVRALYDVWKRKCPGWEAERVEPLLAALGSQAPLFLLPTAGASHTRSYLHKNTTNPAGKTLIFDGFVAVQPESDILMHWPGVDLKPEQRSDLKTMLGLLNFLGRSESWVAADVTDAVRQWNCVPAPESSIEGELVDVACATPPAHFVVPKRKGAPKTWLDAITYSTTRMLKDRASQPPALQSVPYVRSRDALDAPPVRVCHRAGEVVSGVLYSLSGPVLPRLTSAMEIAEQIRTRLMGIHRKQCGDDASRVSPKFSGHDSAGRALHGHQHCFIQPFSQYGGHSIDSVLVWCRQGFDRREVLALHRLTRLWQRKGKPDVRCVAVAARPHGLLRKPCRVVESVTPFVPPRHFRRGRGDFSDWLREELKQECTNHGLPEPIVAFLEASSNGLPWREFRRSRKGEAPRYGCGFRLEFDEPVLTPFALGYGCHFGLGQFHAATR